MNGGRRRVQTCVSFMSQLEASFFSLNYFGHLSHVSFKTRRSSIC